MTTRLENKSTLREAHARVSTARHVRSAIVQKKCTRATFAYFEYPEFRLAAASA